MIVDGYSVLFLLTLGILVVIILAIFVQRQIFRLRNNSARKEPNVTIGDGLSKRRRVELSRGIEVVRQFQLLRAPKFTDINTIGEHAKAPYIDRMIALDELREIDRQLEFINPELVRVAGETTYGYLSRLRRVALPSLQASSIERLGFLAEHARYRHEHFGDGELAELRSIIKDIFKILNNESERLSSMQLKTAEEPLSSVAFHRLSKRLTADKKVGKQSRSSVKRADKFSTNSQIKISAGSESLSKRSGTIRQRQKEQEYELPLLGDIHEPRKLTEKRVRENFSGVKASDVRSGLDVEKAPLIKSS